MIRQPENMAEIGLRLRDHVGELMMQRMKEDELTGLPKKSGHNQAVPIEMTAEQADRYDAIVTSAQSVNPSEESRPARQNRQLAQSWQPSLLKSESFRAKPPRRKGRRRICSIWVQVNPKLAKRLLRLIEETKRDPFGGAGKPEP